MAGKTKEIIDKLCKEGLIKDFSITVHINNSTIKFFEKFEKPFLCVGAGDDPVTNGFEKPWLEKVPGTKGQPHANIGGGHFLQWARAKELSELLVDFVKTNQ